MVMMMTKHDEDRTPDKSWQDYACDGELICSQMVPPPLFCAWSLIIRLLNVTNTACFVCAHTPFTWWMHSLHVFAMWASCVWTWVCCDFHMCAWAMVQKSLHCHWSLDWFHSLRHWVKWRSWSCITPTVRLYWVWFWGLGPHTTESGH